MILQTPQGSVPGQPMDILNWYECLEDSPDGAGSRVLRLYGNPSLEKNVLVCAGYENEYYVIYHDWDSSYSWYTEDLREYETFSGAISRARSVCQQNITPPWEFAPEPRRKLSQ